MIKTEKKLRMRMMAMMNLIIEMADKQKKKWIYWCCCEKKNYILGEQKKKDIRFDLISQNDGKSLFFFLTLKRSKRKILWRNNYKLDCNDNPKKKKKQGKIRWKKHEKNKWEKILKTDEKKNESFIYGVFTFSRNRCQFSFLKSL